MQTEEREGRKVRLCDPSASLFYWKTRDGSRGRWAVESLLRTEGEEYVLLKRVMACEVYGRDPLFRDPPYAFQALFGRERFRFFRTYAGGVRDDSLRDIEEVFSEAAFVPRTGLFEEAEGHGAVAGAFEAGKELRCTARYAAAGREIELSFPVEHVNLSADGRFYQVETGPVPVWNGGLEKCRPGYAAFRETGVLNLMTDTGIITSRKADIKWYVK